MSSPATAPPERAVFLRPRVWMIAGGIALAAAIGTIVLANQVTVFGETRPVTQEVADAGKESSAVDAPERTAENPVAPEIVALPHDQLNAAEVDYLRSLAGASAEYATTTDVDGKAGAQFITAAVASQPGDTERTVTLSYYDYTSNQDLTYTINATTRTITSATFTPGLQRFATPYEIDVAYQLLLKDPLSTAVKEDFLKNTGTKLATTDQTINSAHTYAATEADTGAETCGSERCLQVLARIPDGPFLATTPYIVNLSTRTVVAIK